jgi:hypothetical protein
MMGQQEAPRRDVSHKKSDEDGPSRRKPMQIVIPHATSSLTSAPILLYLRRPATGRHCLPEKSNPLSEPSNSPFNMQQRLKSCG